MIYHANKRYYWPSHVHRILPYAVNTSRWYNFCLSMTPMFLLDATMEQLWGADVSARGNLENTALHSAAWNKHEKVVQLLLEKGSDMSDGNTMGDNALHLAARAGDEAVVKLLLDRGADTSARNNLGNPVLHNAAIGGQEATLQLLLDRDVDISARGE